MSLGFQLRAKQGQVFRMGQVVSVLQMSSGELDEHLAEAAQDNPMFILRRRPMAGSSVSDAAEMATVAEAGSLYEHVSRALAGLIGEGGLMERIITAFMEELEPSGWMGRAPEEIAETLEISPELVEAALRVVQKRVEPAGLFALNLEDCLRLQLEDKGPLSDDIRRVLAELSTLEVGGIDGLVRATGLGAERVRACLDQLRRLDPKPGSAFATDPTLAREPDVRITPRGDGWDIEYLSALHREIEIVPMPRHGQTADARAALARARALKQALDVRQSALRQVVAILVERQGAYFRAGASALKPMTMSEIAQETGFHLSTVSRVLSGLLIEGPNGITIGRSLFAGTASAQTLFSKPQVQARIRALLDKEDPAQPLSDRRMTALLQAEGITVSRRVVSNYRQEIGISPAAKRRLRA
ncbi:RNA polymerase subunit sigma-54 [Antarctobacter sp.]|uniref:RNA polymerase factor sigma-54 n=1 Tax=Antarctobacter sp. TaxID=1872577 RepID=UPI003A8F41C0